MKPGRVGQRRAQKVLVLQCVTLRGEQERRIIEHVLSHRRPDQEADVEPARGNLAVQAEREVRIGIADDGVVVGGRVQRLPVDASRALYLRLGGGDRQARADGQCTS